MVLLTWRLAILSQGCPVMMFDFGFQNGGMIFTHNFVAWACQSCKWISRIFGFFCC